MYKTLNGTMGASGWSRDSLPMCNVRQVPRLAVGGISNRLIGSSLSVSKTKIRNCLRRIEAGLAWPLPDDLTDAVLEARLYPPPDSMRTRTAHSPIGQRSTVS